MWSFYILHLTIWMHTAQMGPPLCSRGKRTGYVDLRHVLFGDHTVGKPTASLSHFLVAICCLLRRTFEWTRRSGTVLTSLGCRPVEAHCINIWLIRLNLLLLLSCLSWTFLSRLFVFRPRSSLVVLLLPGSHWITGSAYHTA
jgi:hypothetical protein